MAHGPCVVAVRCGMMMDRHAPDASSRVTIVNRARPHICFVAHNAFGELAGVDTGHAGGIERQQALMARWLAARAFDVDMVTWHEGQPDGGYHRGVRVRTLCRREAGLPGLRFVHPRWTSLNSALGRARADVYYYNCGDMGLGQISLWCRRKRVKLVYSVASEPDCDPRLPSLRDVRERILYRYGLHRASRIIAQTHRQQRLLREGFGVESIVLPMPASSRADRATRSGRPIPPAARGCCGLAASAPRSDSNGCWTSPRGTPGSSSTSSGTQLRVSPVASAREPRRRLRQRHAARASAAA